MSRLVWCSIFGAVLGTIGCSSILPTKTSSYIKYTVRPGDTLYTIGRRFDVAAEELVEVNNVRDPKLLMIGTHLKVPYRGQSLEKTQADVTQVKRTRSRKFNAPYGSSLKKVRLADAKPFVGRLGWPVKGGGPVSSSFGWRWLSFHEGIDIPAKHGVPVVAAHRGTIVYSGKKLSGYGNIVVLRGEGIVTVYGHNKKNKVKAGQVVRRGQMIAEVGSSGKASGPHLHFETRVSDKRGRLIAVDPMVFFERGA